SQEEWWRSVALDIQAMAQHRQNPLGDFKPRGGEQVLEELGAVNEVVTAKATPEETAAFRGWLLAAAQAAADAGKGGGFLGFGAERVSAGERRMLDQVRTVLGMACTPDGPGAPGTLFTLHGGCGPDLPRHTVPPTG